MGKLNRRKKVLFSLIVGGIVGFLIECSAFFVCRFLDEKAVVYWPLSVSGVGDYLQIRDPLLGWPAPSTYGIGELDRTGARVSPAFVESGHACISVYGDSFTFGLEVDPTSAWPNQLQLF